MKLLNPIRKPFPEKCTIYNTQSSRCYVNNQFYDEFDVNQTCC